MSEATLETVFDKYASVSDTQGNKFLNEEDFVQAIAPPNENYDKISRDSYRVLFKVADQGHNGLVSQEDWFAFDQLLDRPDAEYQIAFRVFDKEGTGFIDFPEFVATYEQNKSEASLPFDWSSKWASLYLGESSNRHTMNYYQFSQMLRGLVGERIRQAFMHYDKNNTGFITPEEFSKVIRQTSAHKLSDSLLASLPSITQRSTSFNKRVSYATVRAFINVINNSEFADQIARSCAHPDGTFSRKDFTDAAAGVSRFNTFTPLEIDILFFFAKELGPDVASVRRLEQMFDPSWEDSNIRYQNSHLTKVHAAKNATQDPRGFLSEVFSNLYNFTLGSVAGAFGATVVYPIDLVKTRMQNQRKSTPGQTPLYANSIDCFKKVVAREGVRGLYSGLGPQLVGVAPEKAIKLTVNDLVRGIMTEDNGTIPIWGEIIAGGTAGACQVVFTNPLEIVKIRLQVQGEMIRKEGVPKRSAISIVRQLGLVGLYKGATACLSRDVPFSAIYFPAYAHLKKDVFHEGPHKKLSVWELLSAGAIAGIPAAYLTTPCDVIKTRLQVEARAGQTQYKGMSDCARKIYKEEGFKAFFKGGPARILRSSPQFGCTLAAYEVLKRLLPYPGTEVTTEAGHAVPSADLKHQSPIKYLRSRNSLKVLLDIDENFGKWKGAPVSRN